jgi:hypothetical protein
MFYGADRSEMFRRAAEIVDKVLKGTKPADIPVERPKKFDFVINLKAAKQIGLTVPPEVLARASRIIRYFWIFDFGLTERKRMNKKSWIRFLDSPSDNRKSKIQNPK